MMNLTALVSNILAAGGTTQQIARSLLNLLGEHSMTEIIAALGALGASQDLLVAFRKGAAGNIPSGLRPNRSSCDGCHVEPCGPGSPTYPQPNIPPPGDASTCNANGEAAAECAAGLAGATGLKWVPFDIEVAAGATEVKIWNFDRDAYLVGLELLVCNEWDPADVTVHKWATTKNGQIYEKWGQDATDQGVEANDVEQPALIYAVAGYLGAGGPSGTYRPSAQKNNAIPQLIKSTNIGPKGNVRLSFTNKQDAGTGDDYRIPGRVLIDFRGT